MVDVRGQLPMNPDNYAYVRDSIYGHRNLAAVTLATLHYTAGPTNMSAAQVAEIQLARDAAPGTKFPGLAYHYLVDGDGVPNLAWDLDVKVWHSAAPGKNSTSVGICYTGNVEPTEAQLRGIEACIVDAETQLGRMLIVGGHKDDYATECPGPKWPEWKNAVLP